MPHHQSSASSSSSSSFVSKPVKMKRTRQRVDAGEPRNSYASIANFSSRGGYHGYSSKYSSATTNTNTSNHHHHNQHRQMPGIESMNANNGNIQTCTNSNSGSNAHHHHHQPHTNPYAAIAINHHPSPIPDLSQNPYLTPPKNILRDSPFYHRSSCGGGAGDVMMDHHQASFFQQLCHQNPMTTAFINQQSAQQQSSVNKSGLFSANNNNKYHIEQQSSINTDQLNCTGSNYHQAAAFLHQLQSINAHNNGNDSNNMAMAATNLLNNLQSANEIAAATNSLFAANNVFDAQLLRDILESGAAVAAAAAAAAAVANNEMKSSEDKSSKQTSNARNCELTSNKSCSPFRNGCGMLGGEQSNKQQNRFNNVESSEADNRSSSLLFDYIGDSCFGEASCKQPVDPAGPKDHVLNIEQDERGENSTNDIIAGLHEEDPVNRSKQTDCTENDDDDPKMKATSLNEGSGINESQTNNDDDCRGEVVVVVTAAEMERDGNLAKEEQYANNARPPLHSLNTSNQPNCAVNKQSSSLGSTFSTASSSSSSEESISLDRSCCASLLNSNHHSNKPSLLCSNQRDLDVDKRHTSLKIHSSVDCSQENMLLERLPNNNSTNRLSTSIMKSDLDDEDDTSASNGHLDHVNSENTTKTTSSCINGAPSTATIIINGCKKRKLYQPQQSTKMVNSSNGSIDTEDDLDDEDDDVDEDGDELVNSNNNNNNDDDDDNEPNNDERRLHSIEVEDMSNVGVVGEDDEGYDESGVVLQDQQQQQRSQLSQHQSSMIEETKSNIELNHKELDLSLTSSTSSHNIDAQQRSNINNDSTINNNKRARMSDYERDLSKFQQQLFQKYTAFQLFQQQQQQSKSNGRSPSTTANTATSYNQRSSPLSNVIMNNTNVNTQSNHSDCDMINIAPDAATLFAAAAVAASESFGQMSPSAAAHLPQQQPQQQQPASSDKICKIYDMDLFVEAVTSQVIQSMSRIVANSIRSHIEAQQQHQRPQQTQPTITNQRSSVKETNTSSKAGATDLLAQMLDAKYSRQMKTTASSPVNNNKNGRDASGSPFSVSPVSKASSFVYPPNAAASGFGYGKQASGMYGRDTPVMVNTNSTSSNSYPVAATAVSPVMAAEQTEAISLVVGPAKKRRNKVTDSRLPVRTPTRINRTHNNDDHLRETLSVSPPLLTNGGSVHFPTAAATANSLPGSLASLQHANEFFDPTTITTATGATTPFSFGEQPAASRLANSLFNAEDVDQLKNSLTATNTTNGSSVNGAVASSGTDAVANAVAAAATAHHLRMFVASRASPDSMSGGYPGAVLSSYGRGSGTGSENGGDGSETNDTQSLYDPSMPMTSTLSPMHLRKAKLMFFYVRYPSSSILKMFFPDIKFNKNNTAQLVKWFSNFREFYYIQMEKYARQALSEGTKGAEDLHVTDDCELLRVLNLHYNRSNHIAIPENFRSVSETTLREFFKSLQQNKDTEQSWKKAIYKIIARLDDNVPEYFKNPNFMEQLE